MGENRTLRKLAEATGRSFSHMSKLSMKHNWKQRILEETQATVDSINAQYAERRLKQTESRVSLAERLYNKLDASFDSLEIENVRDFKTVLEAYNLLTGRATVITEDVTTLPLESLSDDELAKLANLLVEDKTVN